MDENLPAECHPKLSGKGRYTELDSKITGSAIPMGELFEYFKTKCSICGHHRIMHDESGRCDGVMNKPCNSGCDGFVPE